MSRMLRSKARSFDETTWYGSAVDGHGDLWRRYGFRPDGEGGGAVYGRAGRCGEGGVSIALRELPSAGSRRTQRRGGTRGVELRSGVGRPHDERPAHLHSNDHAAWGSREFG